ncbi:glycosyltransferase 87 family protein [Mesorhizobium sp. 1M-11]|uniref:glycosyltransferase 87 family protein n=1 Tax=Mesorhizobium sp. 1M-11 TaxID=1529006 RepID=UPI0006C7722B|nr:glycosyltransferase 87 family protein [Mesorhizobium sp. 1M-11]
MAKVRQSWDWGGLVLWIGGFVAILVMAGMAPDHRSVMRSYRIASDMFLAGKPLYDLDIAMGYLYSPAFAALYVPFMKLGPVVGDSLWRVLNFAVLTYAVWRQVRTIDPANRLWMFSYALFLAVPITAGALRNGQATILLAGACWLLVLSALEGRRAETFLWATVAVIAKPTAIIVFLLVGALRLRLIPILVLSLLSVLALPYAFAPAGYVNQLYRDFATLMTSMSVDKSIAFEMADFTAPFAALGMPISTQAATLIRIVVALPTLLMVLWYDRNLDRRLAGLAIFLTAAFYMSLLNPRVEYNTFALLAMPAGVALAAIWDNEDGGALRSILAIALFAAGLSGINSHLQDALRLWFRPVAMTAITLPILWWFWSVAQGKFRRAGAQAHV